MQKSGIAKTQVERRRIDPDDYLDQKRTLRLSAALAHPTRLRLLLILDEGVTSPNGVWRDYEIGSLGTIAYHVNKLLAVGAIRRHHTAPRRGATEHYYALSDFGRDVLRAAKEFAAPPEAT